MKKYPLIFVGIIIILAGPDQIKAKKGSGQKPVGIKIISFEHQGKEMPVAIWYPAVSPGDKPFDYNGQNQAGAYQEAEPDRSGGPYPLILFSHGFIGCAFQSVFLVENLASVGYVVAATDHRDSLICEISGPPKLTVGKALSVLLKSRGDFMELPKLLFGQEIDIDMSYRPKELIALVDYVLSLNHSDPLLKSMIDPERIGVAGHSMGGFTALAVSGPVYDCVDPRTRPEELCRKLDDLKTGKARFDQVDTEVICCMENFKGKSVTFTDPRIKAALALSPAIVFPKGALRTVSVPVMIVTGDKKEVAFENLKRAYDEVGGPKYLLTVKDTTHNDIVDITRFGVAYFLSLNQEKQEVYENYSTAFFDAYVKKDAAALQRLQSMRSPLVEMQHAQ